MDKFLVDESAGKGLYDFLAAKGFDVKFITYSLPSASDKRVLDYANRERRILITNDKDFGELVFRIKRPTSGVILVRLQKDSAKKRQDLIYNLINQFPLRNNFIILTDNKVRMRKIK